MHMLTQGLGCKKKRNSNKYKKNWIKMMGEVGMAVQKIYKQG